MIKRGLRTVCVPIMGAVISVLAACAPEPEGNQAQAPAQPTSPSASPAATDNRINLSQCSSPSNGAVHFRIGQSNLAVPAAIVGDVIPANMRPPFQKEAVQAELQTQANAGAGCPEKPLDAALLLTKSDLGHPLLEGTMGLIRTPSPEAARRFAQLTSQLQAKPNRNCKPLSGELLACVGTETRGGKDTPVMYVITTDTSLKMNTGGPLAVRCLLGENKIQGCRMVDQLANGITFDATLNPGDYSTALLSGARSAAVQRVEALRR